MEPMWEGVFARLASARKLVAIALAIAMSPVMVSCYGEFPLTKTVYRINGGVPTGILQQVVFWVFVIVPVYGIAILADVIVLNLIEFWTGAAVEVGSATNPDGSTVVLEPSAGGREMLLTILRDDAVVGQVRFVRISATACEVRDAGGNLAGTVLRTPSGDLLLTDAQGRVVSTVSAAQIAELTSRRQVVPAPSL